MQAVVIGTEGSSALRLDRIPRGEPAALDALNRPDAAVAAGIIWRVLLLVAFVLLTFPPCFCSMVSGLDGSWGIGLNEIANRHLVFGRDVAFTYGPLGFAITPRDVGSNMVHVVMLRVALHVFWWAAVGLLLARTRGYLASFLFAAASVLSGIHFGPIWDVNFQLTGAMHLAPIAFLVLGHVDRRPLWGVPAAIVAAGAMLAKLNIGIACVGSILVWAVIQIYREPSREMLRRLGFVALTYAGALVALFGIYGGPITALGDFFKYSNQLASGYSSQMSGAGPIAGMVVAAAIVAISVLAAAAGVLRRASYAPVLLIILFPLFLLYKGAIVRHDEGHYLVSCPVVAGLIALLLPGQFGRWRSWAGQAVVAGTLIALTWFAPSSVQKLLTRGALSWVSVCKFSQTSESIQTIDARFKDQLKLPPAILARIGSAPIDVYPWDICTVVANGLNWKPRFVMQSYAAYTPVLDRKSAESFRGGRAPEYVLYTYHAIDGVQPCMVDPRTWLEIVRWYHVVDQTDRSLLLERGDTPRWEKVEWLGSKSIAFGDRWNVPPVTSGQVVLQAKLKLSPLGRLLAALYKVYPPTIRIEYWDGSIQEHRLVWQNVESGFLVSSLPRNTEGMRQLLAKGEADRVRSVSFHGANGCFEKAFRASWYRLPLGTSARSSTVSTAHRPAGSIKPNQTTSLLNTRRLGDFDF